jgi:molybdopterin-guanine dinucleotide biosynthesis adapter protein
VEGYKTAPIPKIEVRRREAVRATRLADSDANVIAVAADHACEAAGRPVLALDDVPGIADLIVSTLGMGPGEV